MVSTPTMTLEPGAPNFAIISLVDGLETDTTLVLTVADPQTENLHAQPSCGVTVNASLPGSISGT